MQILELSVVCVIEVDIDILEDVATQKDGYELDIGSSFHGICNLISILY